MVKCTLQVHITSSPPISSLLLLSGYNGIGERITLGKSLQLLMDGVVIRQDFIVMHYSKVVDDDCSWL